MNAVVDPGRGRSPIGETDTGSGKVFGLEVASLVRLVVAVMAGSVALFVVVYFQNVTTVGALTRDPTFTSEEAWYLGAASSLGVIGWAIATGCFTLGALLARRLQGAAWVALAGGASYTFLLLIDDLFLLHDDVLLRAIGSELPIYGTYLLLGALWFFLSVRHLSKMTLTLVVLAVLPLAMSVVVDQVWDSDSDLRLVTEDGLKFLGIWLWAVFAFALSAETVDKSIAQHSG